MQIKGGNLTLMKHASSMEFKKEENCWMMKLENHSLPQDKISLFVVVSFNIASINLILKQCPYFIT
jgi:hypothetical protein